MSRMTPLAISAATLTTSVGRGLAPHAKALLAGQSGLAPCRFPGAHALTTFVGEVIGLDDVELPPSLSRYDCRNQRLAELTLQQDSFLLHAERARERYGAARIGVFMGTSTSGLQQTERAYTERDAQGALPANYHYATTQNTFSLARYVAARLEVTGPAQVISTACSSSAKVFASAYRAMSAGICDAAIVGGVDSLCLTTLFGFSALQLLSTEVCRPADAERRGLSLGEGGGIALLEWQAPARAPRVIGIGESSDAHHMSAPDPDGAGAAAAMRMALARARVQRVDYINLHGTATPLNDSTEDRAIAEVFGAGQPCSSTKGWTGHTLGAAGIVEVLLATLCFDLQVMPCSLQTRQVDPKFRASVVMSTTPAPLRHVLSNSFGFGGSNCSILLEGPQ